MHRSLRSLRFAAILAAAPLHPTRLLAQPPAAGTPTDSGRAKAPVPPWRNRVRYGGGPSVGAPRSDYTGAAPPLRWCLQGDLPATGDFGISGGGWKVISRGWLHDVLSDTTEHGTVWRQVLGGAPRLAPTDSMVEVTDERTCQQIAATLNRELLGWSAGPPPVVVFRVRDYLIAYPSNARFGEFGLAVGMNLKRQIQGVATW